MPRAVSICQAIRCRAQEAASSPSAQAASLYRSASSRALLMQQPARISWNWLKSSRFHPAWIFPARETAPVSSAASTSYFSGGNQAVFRPPVFSLDGAVGRVAADGVVLEIPRHHGQVKAELPHGGEIFRRGGVPHLRIVRRSPFELGQAGLGGPPPWLPTPVEAHEGDALPAAIRLVTTAFARNVLMPLVSSSSS